MNIFRVNWLAKFFFHLIFPCANFFFLYVARPPPNKFSNGPSLREYPLVFFFYIEKRNTINH